MPHAEETSCRRSAEGANTSVIVLGGDERERLRRFRFRRNTSAGFRQAGRVSFQTTGEPVAPLESEPRQKWSMQEV